MRIQDALAELNIAVAPKEYVFDSGGPRVDVPDRTGRFMEKATYLHFAEIIKSLTPPEQKLLTAISTHSHKRSVLSPIEDPKNKEALTLLKMHAARKGREFEITDASLHNVLHDMVGPEGKKSGTGPGFASKIWDIQGQPVSERYLASHPAMLRSFGVKPDKSASVGLRAQTAAVATTIESSVGAARSPATPAPSGRGTATTRAYASPSM